MITAHSHIEVVPTVGERYVFVDSESLRCQLAQIVALRCRSSGHWWVDTSPVIHEAAGASMANAMPAAEQNILALAARLIDWLMHQPDAGSLLDRWRSNPLRLIDERGREVLSIEPPTGDLRGWIVRVDGDVVGDFDYQRKLSSMRPLINWIHELARQHELSLDARGAMT